MQDKSGTLRVGTSGYQYDHWKGLFYPGEIRKRDWFQYYAKHFDTVEINNTFYRLPETEIFKAWRAQAPRGFAYALKFSRYGSHIKRLKDPHGAIGTFVERASHLGKLLGAILVQLPPNWGLNIERLESFLEAAPTNYRWAMEFRNPSWLCSEVYELLRGRNWALCIHDMIENHPREITADWVYLRFHGGHYDSKYPKEALRAEARRVKGYLAKGLDVFVYFNNDAHGHAVSNAMDLRRYAGEIKTG